MKVYLLVYVDWDDYSIRGVFLTPGDAEKARSFARAHAQFRFEKDKLEIEEFEANTFEEWEKDQ